MKKKAVRLPRIISGSSVICIFYRKMISNLLTFHMKYNIFKYVKQQKDKF